MARCVRSLVEEQDGPTDARLTLARIPVGRTDLGRPARRTVPLALRRRRRARTADRFRPLARIADTPRAHAQVGRRRGDRSDLLHALRKLFAVPATRRHARAAREGDLERGRARQHVDARQEVRLQSGCSREGAPVPGPDPDSDPPRCPVSCRMRPESPGPSAEALADRAKALAVAHLALPSLDIVFGLLLLAYHEHGADRDSGLWAYCGLAIRMCIDLGLHKVSQPPLRVDVPSASPLTTARAALRHAGSRRGGPAVSHILGGGLPRSDHLLRHRSHHDASDLADRRAYLVSAPKWCPWQLTRVLPRHRSRSHLPATTSARCKASPCPTRSRVSAAFSSSSGTSRTRSI